MNLPDGKYITSPHLVTTMEREIEIREGKVRILAYPFTLLFSQEEFFEVNKLIKKI